MDKTKDKEPPSIHNILLVIEVCEQPFCTRGYYRGDGYYDVITWRGKKRIRKDEIKYWMPLPSVDDCSLNGA